MKIRSVSPLDYVSLDEDSLIKLLRNRMRYTIGEQEEHANDRSWYQALVYVIRDRLLDRLFETLTSYERKNKKRVYYLSLEFLIGRMLQNALISLDFQSECQQALMKLGLQLEQLQEKEPDAALGNGGLGRLAACFLDSMASLGIPGFGYGIRYEYGMFNQRIEQGCQVEHPDNWLRYGNPWEIPHADVIYPVHFYGYVEAYTDADKRVHHVWKNTQDVMAMAYDLLVPGFRNNKVNRLRLWSAKSSRDFDLRYFNEGDYIRAVEDKTASENLSRVLYPDDSTDVGRKLRLKQEYFFVSAALQDILHEFTRLHNNFNELPTKIAIQLNDTHPAIAVPELMRLLMDEYKMEWDQAWPLCTATFAYTNHTLMPEALETWSLRTFEHLLPRHTQIILEINKRFLTTVEQKYPGDHARLRRLSIIDEDGERRIRMANLAIIGSHAVNGVSRIHTEILKTSMFADFQDVFPGKFMNMTNGINPRRWLRLINPRLANLITDTIGGDWVNNLDLLKKLSRHAKNQKFQTEFRVIKHENKLRLASLIQQHVGTIVDADMLFDVQIKRIHEYKRQLLNLLHVITLYRRLISNPQADLIPRCVIISGKAAPGYKLAKLVIRLICDVAAKINHHPVISKRLKLIFIPNYDVTTAGDIIPAADLSEQISLAGTEASGTGNMKLALNGALTIGTMDGANIEIREQVGADNIFIFGLNAKEATHLASGNYRPRDYIRQHAELLKVIDMIEEGHFSPDEPQRYHPIVDILTRSDRYLLMADYAAYLECQARVEQLYREPSLWTEKAILNVAAMGYFSSDRTIGEYARHIWDIKP